MEKTGRVAPGANGLTHTAGMTDGGPVPVALVIIQLPTSYTSHGYFGIFPLGNGTRWALVGTNTALLTKIL